MSELAPDPDAEPGEEYVTIPPEPSLRRKVAWVIGGLGAFLLVVLAVGGVWILRQVDPGGVGEEVTVTIPEGSTTAQIASLLEREGVVTNATVFRYYVRWRDVGAFRAGTYDGLRKRSSMAAVVNRLQVGPLPPRYTEVPIPEGFWLKEIRARILEIFPQMSPEELDVALATVRSRYQPPFASLEGLLFPATYRVEEGDELDEQKLVRQMVAKFEQVADELGLDGAAEKLQGVAGRRQISPYEVVIVASMIEEEAKAPEEKPMIARVIYNRLAEGMPLGIDATVIYALGEHKEQLTRSDLEIDSPYNTRRFPGLPPTPIASPGRESLEAALNPADGPWLYYVLTDEQGHHHFTDDYNDFLRAQRDARSRGLL
ncbi:MAG: endolytic transglycosylase MltG [Acidimicrobiales bacterium]